jgi:hypothetical protein
MNILAGRQPSVFLGGSLGQNIATGLAVLKKEIPNAMPQT